MRHEDDSPVGKYCTANSTRVMMGGRADSKKTIIPEAGSLRARMNEIITNKTRHCKPGHPGLDFMNPAPCKADTLRIKMCVKL